MSKMPHCMGQYEPKDTICNGDPEDGATEGDKAPCAWRDRCAGFQYHLAESGMKADALIDVRTVMMDGKERYFSAVKVNPDKFNRDIEVQIKRYAIKDGLATTTPELEKQAKSEAKEVKRKEKKPKPRKRGRPRAGRPTLKARRAARAAIMAARKERRERMDELFNHFKSFVVENLPQAYRFSSKKQAVATGQLHIVDRLDTSGYATIYCRAAHGRDKPVALLKYKPRTMTMDVEVAASVADIKELNTRLTATLNVRPVIDGMFRSVMLKLDKQHLAMAAEAIGGLVNRGKIDLPPM